jgi:hypothetical protein
MFRILLRADLQGHCCSRRWKKTRADEQQIKLKLEFGQEEKERKEVGFRGFGSRKRGESFPAGIFWWWWCGCTVVLVAFLTKRANGSGAQKPVTAI